MRTLLNVLFCVSLGGLIALLRLTPWRWFRPIHSTIPDDDVKVYVYKVPEKLLQPTMPMDYNSCPDNFYNIEIALPKLLEASQWAINAKEIRDAAQADYFLVPH